MEWIAIKAVLSGALTGIGRFISKMVTFFTTKPGVYLGLALLAAGIIWRADHEGYRRGVAEKVAEQKLIDAKHAVEDQRLIAEAYKDGLARQKALDATLADIADKAAKAREASFQQTIRDLKRIASHVTPETDRKYPMPCGLYRVLRAKADHSRDPETVALPPGLSDGDTCPVTASDIADNGVAIIGRWYEAVDQIAELQELVKALAAEIEK